jgi:hypothetical protein
MTHDELLAKVSNYKDAGLGSLVALRAVVELHKPQHSIRGYRCTFDDEMFPCKNIQAIQKELS